MVEYKKSVWAASAIKEGEDEEEEEDEETELIQKKRKADRSKEVHP